MRSGVPDLGSVSRAGFGVFGCARRPTARGRVAIVLVLALASLAAAATAEAAPANDNFANATAVGGFGFTLVSESNVGASREANEPSILGRIGGASVWYSWTAPATSPVTIDTAGSGLDTLLGVYTGDAVGALTLIAENDDEVPGSIFTSKVAFTAQVGVVYRIAVDGFSGVMGTFNLTLTFPPPPNDAFANAIALTGSSATRTGDFNVGASMESGEQDTIDGAVGDRSVWYSWTAPVTGPVSVDTAGSSFDTMLGVYTGSAVNALTAIAGNNDRSGSDTTSLVTFTAQAGTTYQITVNGTGFVTGTIDLNLAYQPPANDAFANAQAVSGPSVSVEGAFNAAATRETGEPTIALITGGASIWYRWTAPFSGAVAIDTTGSSFDTLLGVYTGTAVDATTLVVDNDDSPTAITSLVTFQAQAGTAYAIAIDGIGGAQGVVNLHVAYQPPANDAFANALPIDGTVVSRTGDLNAGATRETGEPMLAGNPGGASVWYAWSAPFSGTVVIDTSGSVNAFATPLDTLLGVYTGSAVDALTLIAENDDSGGVTSLVTFTAQAMVTYQIAVDGFSGAQGSIDLHLVYQPPANDAFANAQTLADIADARVADPNLGATIESGEPATIASSPSAASIWYTWTAPLTSRVTISTDGSVAALGGPLNTLLAVYTGDTVDALSLVVENDDEFFLSDTSLVTFLAQSGTAYRIAVDSVDGAIGTVNLGLQARVVFSAMHVADDRAFLGQARQLTAIGTYTDGTEHAIPSELTWSSDDPTIATVDSFSGLVTTVAAGTTTIRAVPTDPATTADTSPTAQATFTVDAAGIAALHADGLRVKVGETTTAPVQGDFTDGASLPVVSGLTWASSDEAVASVDPSTGAITGTGLGDATITATVTDAARAVLPTPQVAIAVGVDPPELGFSHVSAKGTYKTSVLKGKVVITLINPRGADVRLELWKPGAAAKVATLANHLRSGSSVALPKTLPPGKYELRGYASVHNYTRVLTARFTLKAGSEGWAHAWISGSPGGNPNDQAIQLVGNHTKLYAFIQFSQKGTGPVSGIWSWTVKNGSRTVKGKLNAVIKKYKTKLAFTYFLPSGLPYGVYKITFVVRKKVVTTASVKIAPP